MDDAECAVFVERHSRGERLLGRRDDFVDDLRVRIVEGLLVVDRLGSSDSGVKVPVPALVLMLDS